MIKISMRDNKKAMVKFTHPEDEKYFIFLMLNARDDGKPHPKIKIRNRQGDRIPSLQPNIVKGQVEK